MESTVPYYIQYLDNEFYKETINHCLIFYRNIGILKCNAFKLTVAFSNKIR